MINLRLGPPGGGKSYEAVVFHILVALGKGRKVITNLALNLEAFAVVDPSFSSLIEHRKATLAVRAVEVERTGAQARFMARLGLDKVKAWNFAAFSHVEDFGDPWRHSETGAGPLYVIDECHISRPKLGTPVAVEEWFSLHRHEFADVLLLSQGYGKINAAVRELVQVVYRVRKNVALGSSKSYTRKVQDGLRGEVVNTAIRRYQPKFFSLYRSHTRSAAGVEMGAADIIPIWRHWSVWAFGAVVIIFVVFVSMSGNPFRMFGAKPVVPVGVVDGRLSRSVSGPAAVGEAPSAGGSPASGGVAAADSGRGAQWPYGALQMHVGGVLHSARRSIISIVFSQNGQKVFSQSGAEVEAAGYRLTALNDCLVRVEFGTLSQFISCDSPRVGIGSSYSKGVPEKAGAADAVPVER